MNCNNVRKYFNAFIDGALDVERNIDVLSHLEMCFECSSRIEAERAMQKRLKEAVCAVNAPANLIRAVRDMGRAEKKPGVFRFLDYIFSSMNVVVPLGGMAIVLIGIAVFFFSQNNKVELDGALRFAESQFHGHLMSGAAPDLETNKTSEVVEFILNNTGVAASLPYISEEAELVGVSMAMIEGKSSPLVFYNLDGSPVALFIDNNADVNFATVDAGATGRSRVFKTAGYCGECQIVEWNEVGNKYIMVSQLDSSRMIDMVTRV